MSPDNINSTDDTYNLETNTEATSTSSPSGTPTQEPAATLNPEPSPAPTEDPKTMILRQFYYAPLTEEQKNYITGCSYPDTEENLEITYDDLFYVHILHYNFEGEVTEGEIICNSAIAADLLEIFYELYLNEYQLEKVTLIENYGGDDELSMADNNTSCFNYRVVSGSKKLSQHAYGLAIDINPFYNPYVTYPNGGVNIAPAGSEAYADRTASFPYKIDENDLCYKLFKEHGFTWGGDWNSSKDYQHFQKSIE
ncbi:MAG: M15 family metallopeptidase [Lachnospiraceae bacterium]|nr:M15 family metallopeptidase [Lachnospiraceae bacterium]